MASKQQAEIMARKGFAPASAIQARTGNHVSTIYRQIEGRKVKGHQIGRAWYIDVRSYRAFLGTMAELLDGIFNDLLPKAEAAEQEALALLPEPPTPTVNRQGARGVKRGPGRPPSRKVKPSHAHT